MDATLLLGRQLESVWISHPRVPVHEAWIDARTPDINSPFVHLAFAGTSVVEVVPCEVNVPDQYPSLGIELRETDRPVHIKRWPGGPELPTELLHELASFTPANIASVRIWDALGEGVPSAVDLTLSTGITVTVRHIYPPMTLGVDLQRFSEGVGNEL